MDIRKLCKTLLYPPLWIMLLLVPISVGLLVPSMLFVGTSSFIAIFSYVLSAYALTVWCMRIPRLVEAFKVFKKENRYARRWFEDERLRVNVSLYGTLVWNTAYAVLQLWLGIYHHTFWFCSLAGYYVLLAAMRFFLVRYLRGNRAGERMHAELVRYRACGYLFLIINLALSVMVFFMVYWSRTFIHDEITTITMAAYTFTSFAFAIVNIVKYRKYNSPIYSASKAISLAAASVSILTLESTMLNTFGDGTLDAFSEKLLLGLSGGVIAAFIIVMSVYMIVESTKKLNSLKAKEDING